MMKRFSMVYPPQEKKNPRNNFMYSTEFQAMLDGLEEEGDDCTEEIGGQGTEKKRRLSLEQVKALEKIFEVDNKLEPERKVRIAEELGLQPRQVAIWFQNRRARWKTKQLERDYGLLKANYEALKVTYDNLEKQREALKAELKELGAKLGEENTDNNDSAKEEMTILIKESENKFSEVSLTANPDHEVGNLIEIEGYMGFNEESHLINPQLLLSPASSSLINECSSSMYWMNCFQFFDSRAVPASVPAKGYPIPHQFVRMEEESLFSSGEESSGTIFSVDQAPTLHWHWQH